MFKNFCFAVLAFVLVSAVSSMRIPLPKGALVETIVHYRGSEYLLSNIITGDILKLNARTNKVTTAVKVPPGRNTQGIAIDKKSNVVLGAGSGPFFIDFLNGQLNAGGKNPFNYSVMSYPPSLNAYNVATGKPIVSCPLWNGIVVNDVTILKSGKFAYFTDSVANQIYRMDLTALPKCRIRVFKTPSTFTGPSFFASGIATYQTGLLIANFNDQNVYFYDLKTKAIDMILPKGVYGSMDAIRVVGAKCLVVAVPNEVKIKVFKLGYNKSTRKATATYVRDITDSSFREPSSLVIRGRRLIMTNMNTVDFGNSATGTTWLSSVTIPSLKNLC